MQIPISQCDMGKARVSRHAWGAGVISSAPASWAKDIAKAQHTGTHPECEQSMEAEPESQGEQGKTGIGAGNAKATDGQELLEEVALAHRQSGIEYDGREEEPDGGERTWDVAEQGVGRIPP